MQDPDNNNNNNNRSDDREAFKRGISMPMSNQNPFATATNNIEADDAGTPWRSDTVDLGEYQVPSEQAELRYDGGRGADF